MDDRGSKRVVADIELDACLDAGTVRVFVYDLATDGCMIKSRTGCLPAVGRAIKLQLPHAGWTAGTLAWTKGNHAGVQFTSRLDETVVDRIGFKPRAEDGEALKDRLGRPANSPQRTSRPLRWPF